jgi:hypothetical protein
MATPIPVQPFIVTAVGLLIAWRVYSRVRRAVGRQRFSARRSWVAVILYPVAALALSASTLRDPLQSLWEVAGIAVGIALAVYGLQKTKFEITEEGWYYTPHTHIGIALSLLLIGRVAYRLLAMYTSTDGFTQPPHEFIRSPWTLSIVGTLLGYYCAYSVGLLRWSRTASEARPGASAP